MIQPEDITSLTDFKRDTSAHVRKLRRTGRPQVLTVNGKAVLVVLDAAAYQELAALIDRAEAIEGIRRGMEDFASGRARPARTALESARRAFHRKSRPRAA